MLRNFSLACGGLRLSTVCPYRLAFRFFSETQLVSYYYIESQNKKENDTISRKLKTAAKFVRRTHDKMGPEV